MVLIIVMLSHRFFIWLMTSQTVFWCQISLKKAYMYCYETFAQKPLKIPLKSFLSSHFQLQNGQMWLHASNLLPTSFLMVQLDSKQRTGCTNTNVLKLTRSVINSPLLDCHIYSAVLQKRRSPFPEGNQFRLSLFYNCTLGVEKNISSQCHFITIHGWLCSVEISTAQEFTIWKIKFSIAS